MADPEPAPFCDIPDPFLRYLPAAHPEMPVATSHAIAVIESNAPVFPSPSKREPHAERYEWISFLLTLEDLRIHAPAEAVQRGWCEFVAAKAPTFSEAEMDAIAQSWWSAMGNRAVAWDAHDALRDASWEEVRTHFQTLKTGTIQQARAAKYWLINAQNPEGRKHLTLPSQLEGVSPLAMRLTHDIELEMRIYAGKHSLEKLRRIVENLIAGKFLDENTRNGVSAAQVDALLERVASDDRKQKRSAMDQLEQWLKQALEADLKKSTPH